VVLDAVNEMFPEPLVASPMDAFVLDQLNTVPVTAPVNVTDVVDPLQTTLLLIGETVGGQALVVILPFKGDEVLYEI